MHIYGRWLFKWHDRATYDDRRKWFKVKAPNRIYNFTSFYLRIVLLKDRDRRGSWIYLQHYTYVVRCLSPITLWVRITLRWVLDTTLCDTVCHWLWQVGGFLRSLRFPPSITLSDRHDITEILLKLALDTITNLLWRNQTYREKSTNRRQYLNCWTFYYRIKYDFAWVYRCVKSAESLTNWIKSERLYVSEMPSLHIDKLVQNRI